MTIATNVINRDFLDSNLTEKYIGYITYIHIGEGWLYLEKVIDLYAKRVVGWSRDDNMKVDLINYTLTMAIQ